MQNATFRENTPLTLRPEATIHPSLSPLPLKNPTSAPGVYCGEFILSFFDLFRLNLPLGNFLILNGRVCLISLVKLWKESHLAWPMKMEEIFQMKCLPLQMCGNVSLLMIQFETSTNSYFSRAKITTIFWEFPFGCCTQRSYLNENLLPSVVKVWLNSLVNVCFHSLLIAWQRTLPRDRSIGNYWNTH